MSSSRVAAAATRGWASRAGAAQGGRRIPAQGLRDLPDDAAVVAVPAVPWQYLGPTNISGRATDIAVADRGRRAASTPATPRAASGRPTTTARRGSRSSTTCRRPASAIWPSRPRTPTSSGSAPARRTSSARRCPASASTSRPTAARRFTHMGLDRHADDRPHRRPPDQPRHRLRRRLRPRVDRQRDARRVQDHRRRQDAGRRCFYKSPRTGAWDLVMDPANPDMLYASMWQRDPPQVERSARRARLQRGRHLQDDRRRQDVDRRERRPARRRSTADASASTSRARNPKVLYAFVDNYEPGRPPQRGRTRRLQPSGLRSRGSRRPRSTAPTTRARRWRKVSESNEFMTRPLRHLRLGVRRRSASIPTDENTIYTLGLGLNVSTDGGKTFATFANSRRSTATITACGSIRRTRR